MAYIPDQHHYESYKAEFAAFMANEGLSNLTSDSDNADEFSTYPCDVCGERRGGQRCQATGYAPGPDHRLPVVNEYTVCVDCMLFAEYGKIDDMSMMDLDLE